MAAMTARQTARPSTIVTRSSTTSSPGKSRRSRPRQRSAATASSSSLYDEDERAGGLAAKNGLGSGGHVACAIISPLAVPGSYGQQYYHYSVLRTLEDGFGLPSYLGSANDVTPIAVWRTPS